MPLPARIGGPDEEKKPGLVVAIGVKKPTLPSKIGGPSDDEPEGDAETMSDEKALDEAAKEIMAAINDRSDLRLKSALKAFFYACDAQPHDEGEHTEEEGDE